MLGPPKELARVKDVHRVLKNRNLRRCCEVICIVVKDIVLDRLVNVVLD